MTDKVALITGASRGIGKAIAKEVARRGCRRMILLALEEDELKQAAAEIAEVQQPKDGWPILIPGDLTEYGAVEGVKAKLKAKDVFPDVLVNNAGIGSFGDIAESDFDHASDLVELNAKIPLKFIKLFLPDMLERGHGMILNVASVAAFQPMPKMANYGGSKAYLRSITNALWYELQGEPVSVTGLYPGETETGMNAQMGSEHTRLYQWSPLLSPELVAQRGVQAMLDGKRNEIPGWYNKFMWLLSSLLPTEAALRTVGFLNRPA